MEEHVPTTPASQAAGATVLALAFAVGGTPIAWKEFDDRIVIVMQDGRKLTFIKDTPATPTPPAPLTPPARQTRHLEQPRKTSRGQKDKA